MTAVLTARDSRRASGGTASERGERYRTGAALSGTWKVTAGGHHAVYEGRLVVPVEHRDMTAVMERVLRRLRKEDTDERQEDG
jgi:hypothetical protein